MRRKTLPPPEENDPPEEPIVNLTPLIDVVFVVLITFILIAPMLEIDSVDLAPGSGVEKKEAKQAAIVVSVKADNSIWCQGSKVSLPELAKQLKIERKLKPNAIPQLIQDKQAFFGTYQLVKNTLEQAGFEQMDIVLKPGG